MHFVVGSRLSTATAPPAAAAACRPTRQRQAPLNLYRPLFLRVTPLSPFSKSLLCTPCHRSERAHVRLRVFACICVYALALTRSPLFAVVDQDSLVDLIMQRSPSDDSIVCV